VEQGFPISAMTLQMIRASIIRINLEGSHFKNPFFTKHVGKYPSLARKIVLRGISEGVFHKALITAGSGGIFYVSGSIIGCFSIIISRMRLSGITKGVVLAGNLRWSLCNNHLVEISCHLYLDKFMNMYFMQHG